MLFQKNGERPRKHRLLHFIYSHLIEINQTMAKVLNHEFIKCKAKCETLLMETLAPKQSTNNITNRRM